MWSRPMPISSKSFSGKDNPQTVARRLPHLRYTPRSGSTAPPPPLWIVAQALRDPGNLGTILRTGDAVGAGGLILVDDCVDPFSVEAVRASMGALFTQRIAAAPWDDFVGWLRAGPGQLIGTSLHAELDYQAPALREARLHPCRQRSPGPAARL